jgi:putative phosphoribosyl transferase
MAVFRGRKDAGRQLATRLSHLRGDGLTILAIPRGGVPVAAAVAREMKTGFSILPLRRLAISWRPENDYGYVTPSGEVHLNQALVGQARLTPPEIYRIAQVERARLLQDLENWGAPTQVQLQGETALIIDDGMHSGWAMYSAVAVVKKMGAQQIIAAVPVSHFRAQRFLAHHCDEVVCLVVEDISLFHPGNYFDQFAPVTDDEIKALLSTLEQCGQPPAGDL